jgi:methyl-accepting chemotaxis protein
LWEAYVWVNGYDTRMIMHPVRPDLDSQDVRGMRDPNGVPIFVRFVDVVTAQGWGFVSYE